MFSATRRPIPPLSFVFLYFLAYFFSFLFRILLLRRSNHLEPSFKRPIDSLFQEPLQAPRRSDLHELHMLGISITALGTIARVLAV